MRLNVCILGTMDYGASLALQVHLHSLRQRGEVGDTLLLVEHPPVLTVGRRGKRSNILVPRGMLVDLGVGVYDANRGGDVTYHGPGQLVGYAIVDLSGRGRDVHRFVCNLQEMIVRLLDEHFCIEAYGGDSAYTGVWVGEDKIAAIGIAVRRWVTMHGFALNVNTNLDHFRWIVPCGITDKGTTSLQKLTGSSQSLEAMSALIVQYFCEVLGMHPVMSSVEELTAVQQPHRRGGGDFAPGDVRMAKSESTRWCGDRSNGSFGEQAGGCGYISPARSFEVIDRTLATIGKVSSRKEEQE